MAPTARVIALPFSTLMLLWVGAASTQTLPVPSLWAGMTPGAYTVGFTVVPGRSPATSVWFPSRGDGARMTFRDYLGSGAADLIGFMTSAGIAEAAVTTYIDSPMAAARDATAAIGRFPIVAFAQGNRQDAPDQAVLAEFLASHGYVVVTTASPMIVTPMTSESEVGPLAERQASDLADAVAFVATWPSARGSARVAAGHSFGARAALLLAMRDSRVRGVISFDGGIGTATAVDSFRAAPSFSAKAATAPILHFYETLDAFMTPDFTLLQSLPAAVTTEAMAGMHHAHFTTLGFGAATIPELAAVTRAGPEIGASLRRVSDITLAFLTQVTR